MDTAAVGRRVKEIRSELQKRNLDCLIVTKPVNVSYVTAFSGDDSWAIITGAAVYLLTDSRYTEQAEGECIHCRIIERKEPIPEAAAKMLRRLRSVRNAAVEKSSSIAVYRALRKNLKVPLRTFGDHLELLRSTKDACEIAAIKKAAAIAAKALAGTLALLKPGMTENELAGQLDLQIRRLNARNSFDTIVAFGPNASRPHHQPSARKLKSNDTVLIDFGAKYRGYCSDITRSFAVGRPTRLYRTVHDAVEKAQAAAIAAIRAGLGIKQADAVAREVLAKSDLPVYAHGTGHGLGLEIHENPFLSKQGKGKLQAGQVITIEPGVYMPGKLGVRIEDDILVTEAGCEIVTRDCPHVFTLGKPGFQSDATR